MSKPVDSLILDLEARQETALRQLIELEQRIEAVLREAQPAVAVTSEVSDAHREHALDTAAIPLPYAA